MNGSKRGQEKASTVLAEADRLNEVIKPARPELPNELLQTRCRQNRGKTPVR